MVWRQKTWNIAHESYTLLLRWFLYFLELDRLLSLFAFFVVEKSSLHILPNVTCCVLQKKVNTGFGTTWEWVKEWWNIPLGCSQMFWFLFVLHFYHMWQSDLMLFCPGVCVVRSLFNMSYILWNKTFYTLAEMACDCEREIDEPAGTLLLSVFLGCGVC